MLIDPGPGFSASTVSDRRAWRHDASGVIFRAVPAGRFQMGLSDAEVAALEAIHARAEAAEEAEERGGTGEADGGTYVDPEFVAWFLREAASMRPVREVSVGGFLVARHPLTIAQVRHWLPGYTDDYAKSVDEGARLGPADLTALLQVLPFRLPSEAQWEYAARAGTTTLTYRGDGVPSERELLDEFGDETAVRTAENPWGLAAFGSLGEACADHFVAGYDGAPADDRPRAGEGPLVVRGGAADVSPWQGCGEWLALLSASRGPQPSFAAVRPVVDLPAQA